MIIVLIQGFIVFSFIFCILFTHNLLPNPFETFFKKQTLILSKFVHFLNFWGRPKLFLNKENFSGDVKITAVSNKNEYIWYMLRDEKIGFFRIYGEDSRSIFTASYVKNKQKMMNNFFMDKVILSKIKDHLAERNEKLLSLKLEVVFYNSFVQDDKLRDPQNQIKQNLLFEYKNNEL
jgi:hypothetical protein